MPVLRSSFPTIADSRITPSSSPEGVEPGNAVAFNTTSVHARLQSLQDHVSRQRNRKFAANSVIAAGMVSAAGAVGLYSQADARARAQEGDKGFDAVAFGQLAGSVAMAVVASGCIKAGMFMRKNTGRYQHPRQLHEIATRPERTDIVENLPVRDVELAVLASENPA
ncbi:MAG: hypothetical protein V4695_08605 [Pseudomonadota bacterium]